MYPSITATLRNPFPTERGDCPKLEGVPSRECSGADGVPNRNFRTDLPSLLAERTIKVHKDLPYPSHSPSMEWDMKHLLDRYFIHTSADRMSEREDSREKEIPLSRVRELLGDKTLLRMSYYRERLQKVIKGQALLLTAVPLKRVDTWRRSVGNYFPKKISVRTVKKDIDKGLADIVLVRRDLLEKLSRVASKQKRKDKNGH